MQEKGRFLRFAAIVIILIGGGAVSLRAQDVSVAGEWELVAGTQKGSVAWKVVFAQSGETLEVIMTGPRGNDVRGQGTLRRDAIEWSVRMSASQGEFDVVYKGIVTGDAMTGEVKRGNMGTAEWSAKRKTPVQ